MIDPFHVTKYDRTESELEEFLLFCISVAGKSARTTAKCLERYLHPEGYGWWRGGRWTPFEAIQIDTEARDILFLEYILKDAGFGCYRARARSFHAAATSGLDLRTCSLRELEALPGVGPKTARYFVLHSRPGALVAVLDRHMMRWLADCGVPRIAPPYGTPSKSKYHIYEAEALKRIPPWKTAAEFDLEVWTKYAARPSKGAKA